MTDAQKQAEHLAALKYPYDYAREGDRFTVRQAFIEGYMARAEEADYPKYAGYKPRKDPDETAEEFAARSVGVENEPRPDTDRDRHRTQGYKTRRAEPQHGQTGYATGNGTGHG